MKNFCLLLFLCFALKTYSQNRILERDYIKLKTILSHENSFTQLKAKLDSLKLASERKNDKVDIFLNRDIDFNYNHNRIIVSLDFYDYQIDLITKGDSLYFKELKSEFTPLTYQTINHKELKKFIKLRNQFYNSNKSLKDLKKEISLDETFAMFCGFGLSATKEGLEINKLVNIKDLKSLSAMLTNFSCEKQSFAVLGFEMLAKNKIEIPEKNRLLIEHIKNRNSELQTCSGCMMGLVKKIY